MAKFVRPPAERDRIGFSTGLGLHVSEEQEPIVFAFPVEAGLGVSFGDRYDLGFSVGNLLGTVEGNFAVLDRELRLGIIHGVGAGLFATQDVQAVFAHFTGGAMLQVGRRRAFFSALKATRSLVIGTVYDPQPSTYFTGTIGFVPSTGRIKVIPELAVQRSNWRDVESRDPLASWTVVIGVTMLLHYYAPQ